MRKKVLLSLLLVLALFVSCFPVSLSEAEHSNLFSVNVADMTDDQLAEAALIIKNEQRARVKTKVELDNSSLMIPLGKTVKLSASIVDLPDGETIPKFFWSTSDSNIISCNNGSIKGISGGDATVTCSAVLADGTEIYGEYKVKVIIPIKSITLDKKALNLNGGQSVQLGVIIKPENATVTALSFESSDEHIVTVDQNGIITAVGSGNAKVMVSSTDGSNKSVGVSIKVEDRRFSKMVAQRVVYTGIGNEEAMDAYTADGMYYDKRKFHPYGYMQREFDVVSEGEWTTNDGGNTWHVEGLLIRHKEYHIYYLYKFDVRFDGTNYLMENGWKEHSSQLKWLESKDPTKWAEDDLSNLEFYTPFVVSPSLIK